MIHLRADGKTSARLDVRAAACGTANAITTGKWRQVNCERCRKTQLLKAHATIESFKSLTQVSIKARG